MRRKITPINADNFNDLFSPCRFCLYWEAPQKSKPKSGPKNAAALKEKWFKTILSEWGECGKILCQGNVVLAYAQFAPSEYFPQVRHYPAGPANRDAVFVSCLYVASPVRGRGLGKVLLQSVVRDLYKRNFKAIETFASKSTQENPSAPLEFYLKNGFYILRDDRNFPLVRLDLKTAAASWHINVNLQAVLDGLKIPVEVPVPS